MHSEIIFKDREELFNMDGKGYRVIEPHYEEYICLDDDEVDIDLIAISWEAILNYNPYWYNCPPPNKELLESIKERILKAGWTIEETYDSDERSYFYKVIR